MTVADLRAQKGKRQLTMLFVDTPDEAAGDCFVQVGLLYGELCTYEDYIRAAHRTVRIGGDAQYLFAEDVLGYTRGRRPRHAKVYRNFRAEYDRLQAERVAAFKEFKADVDSGAYPGKQHMAPIADAEFAAFMAQLAE